MDHENQDSIVYPPNAKIMISSIVVLFVACFIILIFHIYARWFRRRPVRLHHHRNRRHVSIPATAVSSQGLDFSVINSLPTFIYELKNQGSPLECAVCLSEFEVNETGRVLPECKHCFHVDCIDMWLQSHCDCPLCRTRLMGRGVNDPVGPVENGHETTVSIWVLEDTGSGFGQDQIKNEVGQDSDGNIGSDIESGPKALVTSSRVLKVVV